jgi:Lar family restriction alleviation protein
MILLNCPFCGSDAFIYEDIESNILPFQATCSNTLCEASIKWCDTKEEAIKIWNTRSLVEPNLSVSITYSKEE